MIKVYGSPRSSSGRCFWCLEELGLKYEAVAMNMREKEHKSDAYLEINPNGKVPSLIDGDFVIWESMAINTYLAEKYNPALLGSSPEAKGLVQQWSYWSQLELQAPMIDIFIQLVFVPEEKRDMEKVKSATDKLPGLMSILDKHLSGKSNMVNNEFTLADIHVYSVVAISEHVKFDVSAYKNVGAWMEKIQTRDAYKNYMKLLS